MLTTLELIRFRGGWTPPNAPKARDSERLMVPKKADYVEMFRERGRNDLKMTILRGVGEKTTSPRDSAVVWDKVRVFGERSDTREC